MFKNYLIELWYFFCKYVLVLLTDKIFYNFIFFIHCFRLKKKWYKLDFKSPNTFTEKINYLKLYERNELAPIVADKVLVKDYVKTTIGDKYLIPNIGIFSNANDIDLNYLPNKFIIKANHGSQWNLICNDKTKINWNQAVNKLNNWLGKNAYHLSREWQYKSIKPRLLCEKLLSENLTDYKVFCYDGVPKFIQVDTDRFSNHQRSIFTTKWHETNFQIRYSKISHSIIKPKKLDEILNLSKVLSEKFKFCRVDFYYVNNRIYFGELTNHPGGGIEPFLNYEQDLEFGKFVNI